MDRHPTSLPIAAHKVQHAQTTLSNTSMFSGSFRAGEMGATGLRNVVSLDKGRIGAVASIQLAALAFSGCVGNRTVLGPAALRLQLERSNTICPILDKRTWSGQAASAELLYQEQFCFPKKENRG